MSDLISRADVLEGLKHSTAYLHDDIYTIVNRIPSAETTGALDDAIAKYVADGLMELPSADAVEVVRCKDCKWWKDNIGYYSVSFCPWDEDIGVPDADDFCSYGERREDGGA